MKYQTIEELQAALAKMHDRVINFKDYTYWKEQSYRDKALAHWGDCGSNFNTK